MGKLKEPNAPVLNIGTNKSPEQNGTFDAGVPIETTETGEIVVIDADFLELQKETDQQQEK